MVGCLRYKQEDQDQLEADDRNQYVKEIVPTKMTCDRACNNRSQIGGAVENESQDRTVTMSVEMHTLKFEGLTYRDRARERKTYLQ